VAMHEGVMVFLKRKYQRLAVFVPVGFALLGLFMNGSTAMAFLAGSALGASDRKRIEQPWWVVPSAPLSRTPPGLRCIS